MTSTKSSRVSIKVDQITEEWAAVWLCGKAYWFPRSIFYDWA